MDEPYLNIAFLRVTRVSQLEVFYVPGTRRVHKYRLQASNDGRNWWNHLEVGFSESFALRYRMREVSARQKLNSLSNEFFSHFLTHED